MKIKNTFVSARQFSMAIRRTALTMVHAAKASHIGGVLSIADILGVLYLSVLRVHPETPKSSSRDRFILSKGRCCAGVYAAPSLRGFFPSSELNSYGADGSRLMSHISHMVPGVEFSTGSLGHGLPFGVGKALAAKLSKENWRVFVLLSDGELDEGSNWEAIMFAAHHKLDNLVAIVDYNKLQSLDTIDRTLRLEPLHEKFSAFGWAVKEVDGHAHNNLEDCLREIPFVVGQPSIILAHTVKGKGITFMENKVEWHYRSPNSVELAEALKELEECD